MDHVSDDDIKEMLTLIGMELGWNAFKISSKNNAIDIKRKATRIVRVGNGTCRFTISAELASRIQDILFALRERWKNELFKQVEELKNKIEDMEEDMPEKLLEEYESGKEEGYEEGYRAHNAELEDYVGSIQSFCRHSCPKADGESVYYVCWARCGDCALYQVYLGLKDGSLDVDGGAYTEGYI